ncbi:flagellar biosynthesis protein FliQ [Botrimarina mediterranea]|uniref:Flagellar biosynthetic protein FliQ n=1 Tax=Botrimarina mediterranea TaxID=2528022 RepID=A0A518KBU1_9BACT|nr:flagellar biosynthesis protein FliQ [Botrimarina mediterranea]QDV75262.1 Flagellar biosynthetic protein FliQ [Botrimarina mediterranea]QDV79931.1 Flagellar biosynthetic protein FliQ [Planctomycetes bacterium K2D]
MDPQLAIDISRDALFMTSIISAPVLVAGMFVGLVIGLLQALTQIQEQTVAFVPKLVAMGLALALTLPWILAQLLDYSESLFRNIPSTL